MKRLEEGWFRFGDISSESMGLRLLEMPKRRKAKKRGDYQIASGRDGDLWDSDGAYEAYDITIKCESCDGYDENSVRAWLDGENDLIFSDEPNLVYFALIREYVDFASKYQLFDTKLVTISVHVQPFRRMDPPAVLDAITFPSTIINPSTAPSLPKITVVCSGDLDLYINNQKMSLIGVANGIILDCKLQDAFTLDGALLSNDNVSGKFFVLEPGANMITWVLEDGASVESITIEPRWRCF